MIDLRHLADLLRQGHARDECACSSVEGQQTTGIERALAHDPTQARERGAWLAVKRIV